MKYRSSTEIIDSMLRSIGSGTTKTRIMYSAYLSYAQLSEYLGLLQDRDLVRYDEGARLYLITEKGLKFLNAYEEIEGLMPSAKVRNESLKQNAPPEPSLVQT